MANSTETNRGGLYFIVGVLAAAVIGLGYYVYQGNAADEPDFAISVSEDGIEVENN